MMRTLISWSGYLLTLSLLLLVGGCGSKTGKVTGKVTLNGQPLKKGKVTFTLDKAPSGGKASAYDGDIQDGTFTIPKVPVGSGSFSVSVPDLKQARERLKMVQQMANMSSTQGGGDSKQVQETIESQKKEAEKLEAQIKGAVDVPSQYTDPNRSGLKYTVVAGDQTHDLKLEGQAEAPPEQK